MANDQPDFYRTCAASLARVVQQEGTWPGLTPAGARMARRMAIEDGEVPTSATPDRAPFWQWRAMKQGRETRGYLSTSARTQESA